MVRTPLMATAFVCGICGMVLLSSLASTAPQRWGDQALQLTDGTKIVAVLDEHTLSFRAVAAQSKSVLKDGTYKLTNVGAIRVKDGVIVWDAFGAVEKLKREGLTSGPAGLG
jgi:hypothetical protein